MIVNEIGTGKSTLSQNNRRGVWGQELTHQNFQDVKVQTQYNKLKLKGRCM